MIARRTAVGHPLDGPRPARRPVAGLAGGLRLRAVDGRRRRLAGAAAEPVLRPQRRPRLARDRADRAQPRLRGRALRARRRPAPAAAVGVVGVRRAPARAAHHRPGRLAGGVRTGTCSTRSGSSSPGRCSCVAVIARRQFTARTARRAGLSALLLFVVGVVVVSLVGTWLLTSFANADEVGAGESVANVLLGDLGLVADPGVVAPAVGSGAAQRDGRGRRARQRGRALPVAARTRARSARADEAAVRTMLRDHGDLDSLGYFATRRDKAVVWDHEDPAQARAGVSYRVVRGVSLASGNPVGDPEHWPAAIEALAPRRPGERVVARGHGGRVRGGARVRGGRAHRLRDRRRGDPRPRCLLAQRARAEAGAPGREPAAPPRLRRRGAPPRHADPGGLRPAGRLGVVVARRRWRRARLLDGARPARRPARRRLRARRGP